MCLTSLVILNICISRKLKLSNIFFCGEKYNKTSIASHPIQTYLNEAGCEGVQNKSKKKIHRRYCLAYKADCNVNVRYVRRTIQQVLRFTERKIVISVYEIKDKWNLEYRSCGYKRGDGGCCFLYLSYNESVWDINRHISSSSCLNASTSRCG